MPSSMRRASLWRRVRSLGGQLIRRLGLLPGGQPDLLGEDRRLAGTRLSTRAMMFFADTRDGLYQIEQWYPVLTELDDDGGLTVVCMDSRTAASIRAATGLTVITVAQDSTLDALVAGSDVKLVFYVNYNPLNTYCLRIRSVVHINLLHGESDKSVSVSNQVKAYDFAFVAGQAAVDRYIAYTPLFDARTRCLTVGRPQLDVSRLERRPPSPGSAATVLYAPTWEGASAGVAYGTVRSHGVGLVTSLLEAGLGVRYRPHPLTGVRDQEYGEADARVRALIAEHPAGTLSDGGPLEVDIAAADLLITDVSAVAFDWLPSGRPLVVTTPEDARARASMTPLLELVPRLSVADLAGAGALVADQLHDDRLAPQRRELVTYYLGDVAPGAAMRTFLSTCERLARLRDSEWARISTPSGAPSV